MDNKEIIISILNELKFSIKYKIRTSILTGIYYDVSNVKEYGDYFILFSNGTFYSGNDLSYEYGRLFVYKLEHEAFMGKLKHEQENLSKDEIKLLLNFILNKIKQL